MLVLMTVTHLPTRLTTPLGQPFGYVSAAEGFVLLAAYMCGWIYGRTAVREGIGAMQSAFRRRAFKVYLCQAATLVFLFTVIAALGMKIDQPSVKNLIGFYLQQPAVALWSGLLLVHEPPLLDILPLYVLFMLGSPWLLAYALRHGWGRVLAASAALWLAAQFGLSAWLHGRAVEWLGLPVSFHETGAFEAFAWQLLWVGGLWLGARRNAVHAKSLRFPSWGLWLAAAVSVAGLVWRHSEGQAPFGADESLNLLFDKWLLGPLRLVNLVALGMLVMRFGRIVARKLPRMPWLEALGAASLPVFCAHLVLVLLTLTFLGDSQNRPWWIDGPLLAGCFLALWGVALCSQFLDVRAARKRARVKNRGGGRATSAPAAGSPRMGPPLLPAVPPAEVGPKAAGAPR